MRNQKEFKSIEQRINKIFMSRSMDPGKSFESLEYYREYLTNNISFPFEVTGIEDFDWEEFYVLGPGSKSEYEKLKKTNPS